LQQAAQFLLHWCFFSFLSWESSSVSGALTNPYTCTPHAGLPLSPANLALSPSPLFFTRSSDFLDALIENLEEEDVMRLACHVEAQLAYQATVIAARRAQPMPAYAGAA
jgi:hypothetical protein